MTKNGKNNPPLSAVGFIHAGDKALKRRKEGIWTQKGKREKQTIVSTVRPDSDLLILFIYIDVTFFHLQLTDKLILLQTQKHVSGENSAAFAECRIRYIVKQYIVFNSCIHIHVIDKN
jgi:hypothetical protein